MEKFKKIGNSRAVFDKIFEISRKNENKVCADCNNKSAYVSLEFGVFLCGDCASFLINNKKKVFDLKDPYSFTEIGSNQFENFGNEMGNKVLEEHKSAYFTRPTEKDPRCYREYFLRCKYIDKLFTDKEALLRFERQRVKREIFHKLHKRTMVFNKRIFLFDRNAQCLKMYHENDSSKARHYIEFDNLEVSLQNIKCSNTNVITITCIRFGFIDKKFGYKRYVHAYIDDEKAFMEWYVLLKMAIFKKLKENHLDLTDDQILKMFDGTPSIQGYLFKDASNNQRVFNKKYFVLENCCLRYFDSESSSHPIGEMVISKTKIKSITKSRFHIKETNTTHRYGITICTKNIRIMLYADNIAAQNSWFRELEKLVESPAKTTDYFGPSGINSISSLNIDVKKTATTRLSNWFNLKRTNNM